MKIIFFAHPSFLGQQSMPRYANMLATGMKERGHDTEIWSPAPQLHRLPIPPLLDKKWLGYVDQYVLFPYQVAQRIKILPRGTLFVFTDNALGPWVPLVADRMHIVHCHDFLAQLSALGQIPQNPVHWSGRKYQAFIRRGFAQVEHFICVSNKTKSDLLKIVSHPPRTAEVIYNGLNRTFKPLPPLECRKMIGMHLNRNVENGYIVHVGGNQWYKNRMGVIKIYHAWRQRYGSSLPLILIGQTPTDLIRQIRNNSLFRDDIHFITGADDAFIQAAYSGATCLLFPSHAEGFGWPIAEAMASGCPVITTGAAPMSEVGGDAAYYIPEQPLVTETMDQFFRETSNVLQHVVTLPLEDRQRSIHQGIINAERFTLGGMLDKVEEVYKTLMTQSTLSIKYT